MYLRLKANKQVSLIIYRLSEGAKKGRISHSLSGRIEP